MPLVGAKPSGAKARAPATEQRTKNPEPLKPNTGKSAHVTSREGPAETRIQRHHKPTYTVHQPPSTEKQPNRQVSNKSKNIMLNIKWDNNQIKIPESSAIKVTEKLLNSHLYMAKGSMRATKQPMIIWVNDLQIEAFKESMDISKEVSNRINENGKKHDRDFHFHKYKGQSFALSPSMQQIEVDKETTFVEGQGIYWIKISTVSYTHLTLPTKRIV